MQTSKYLFAAGLLAAVILPLHVQGGPDSEEQAKMREALRRAMEQPGAGKSQPIAPAPTPTIPAPTQAEQQPVATPPPQQAAPVTPVAPPPAPATATVVVETPQVFENVPASDPESMARAREAMRQKMQELQSTPSAAPAPAVTPEPAKPVVAVAPPPAAPKPTPAAEPAPGPTPKPQPKVSPAPVATATSNYKPIEAPASPFSTAKQAKLNEILARYRADAITAQEYHAQRAAIIAEP